MIASTNHDRLMVEMLDDNLKRNREICQVMAEQICRYGGLPMVLVHDQPLVELRTWYGVVIHPSTEHIPNCPLRVSYFDRKGFSSHYFVKGVYEALAELGIGHGNFRLVRPSFLDDCLTPQFVAGCLNSNGFEGL